MSDPVNHPGHYAGPACEHCGKPVEAIVVIEGQTLNVGNAMKYLWRAGRKDPEKHVEDLKKAKWYIDREIARLAKIK